MRFIYEPGRLVYEPTRLAYEPTMINLHTSAQSEGEIGRTL